MRPARLAAHAIALLGPVRGPVTIASPAAARLGAALGTGVGQGGDSQVPAGAIVAFLGATARPAERQSLLRALQMRLPVGAPLVLVDHNQPRALWRRALGVVGLTARGLGPARARYPAARELAALGFAIERLRLTSGERVQLIGARRR